MHSITQHLFIECLQYLGSIYLVLGRLILDAIYCVEDSNILLKFVTTAASTFCGKVDTVIQRQTSYISFLVPTSVKERQVEISGLD